MHSCLDITSSIKCTLGKGKKKKKNETPNARRATREKEMLLLAERSLKSHDASSLPTQVLSCT
jgi:hypothetical protein